MPALAFFFPLITAAVVASVSSAWAISQPIRGNGAFAGLMAALSWWLIAYTFELNSTTLEAALFWGKAQYLSIVLVPPLWLLFALHYSNTTHRLAQLVPLGLFGLAAITLVLVWTNEWHGLIWATVTLETVGAVQMLKVSYGPWFIVHTVAAYTTIISASACLIRFAWQLSNLYRRQAFLLITGALTPMFGNLVYLLRIGPITTLDLTPFFFTITGVLFAWAIYRTRLLSIVPIARNTLVEQMHDSVIVIDPQGTIIDANHSVQSLLGTPTQILIGQSLASYAPLQALAPVVQAAQQQHTLITQEIELDLAQTHLTFEVQLTPLTTTRHQQRGLLIVLRDVTERKRIERELRMQKDLFAGVAAVARAGTERMQISAALRNILHTTIKLTNATQGCIFLIAPDGTLQQNIIVGGPLSPEQEAALAQLVLREGLARWVLELRQLIVIGDTQTDPRWIDLPAFQFSPVRSALAVPITFEERGIGLIALSHHATAHFHAQHADLMAAAADQIALSVRNAQMYETQLALAEQAEASSRAKSAFIANMSHELRTPLTAILGYSDILADELAELQQPNLTHDLEQIKSAGGHLLSLVDTMLDLAHIASGQMQVEYQPVDPIILVQAMIDATQSLAQKNRNILQFGSSADLGLIYTDGLKLQQIVQYLLQNACKFTHAGQIMVTVQREGATPGAALDQPAITNAPLVITICDTGIGMTEAEIAQLFSNFMQADSSSTRRYGGMGLGLALSRQLAHLLGGDITVQSAPGAGSCFTLALPFYTRPQGKPLLNQPERPNPFP